MDKSSSSSKPPENSDKMPSFPENKPPFSLENSSIALGLVTEGHQNIPPEIPETSHSNFSFPETQRINPSFDSQSSKNPMEDNLGFLMRVKPASTLKKAVSSLSDEAFNPEMLGMIQVGLRGFEITVHKKEGTDYFVFGFLSINADCLADFVCETPMRSKVCLNGIKTILDGAGDKDDIVTVFHIKGTNLLSFRFETPVSDTAPGTPFALHIDLLGDDLKYPKFPGASYEFVAVINSKDLIPMCEQALAQPVDNIEVTLTTDMSVKLKAEKRKIITTAPQRRHVMIDWHYWESLEKALSIGDCHLCLVTDPKDCIMLRFQLQGLGYLVFLTNNAVFFFSTLRFTSLL